jgi:tRNA (guanine37-N1)-methyltransferase
MQLPPLVAALNSVKTKNSHVILLSPIGTPFNQKVAARLATTKDLIFVCGHYEGIDERFSKYVDETLSIGDYVLSGGEIATMAMCDAIIRLIDNVITPTSLLDESFNNNLLEYPQYAEPYEFEGLKIPDILYCGNHEIISTWRRKQSLYTTYLYRPDLLDLNSLSATDLQLLEDAKANRLSKGEEEAMRKGSKFLKK